MVMAGSMCVPPPDGLLMVMTRAASGRTAMSGRPFARGAATVVVVVWTPTGLPVGRGPGVGVTVSSPRPTRSTGGQTRARMGVRVVTAITELRHRHGGG